MEDAKIRDSSWFSIMMFETETGSSMLERSITRNQTMVSLSSLRTTLNL